MIRVLLIDDDETLRGVIKMSLNSFGFDVTEAGDGRVGVNLAKSTPFDVVVTDLIMPGQEGIETITILRRELPHLPVIAMSGGLPNSALYLEIAAKIGARRVLGKPFAMADLRTAITEIVQPAKPAAPAAPA
jgi:DNA-binding response OmpR family regulator